MKKPEKLGHFQNVAFPIIQELAENGHLFLSLKTLILATRTDILVYNKKRMIQKSNAKIDKMLMELNVLEIQTCALLHPDC